MTINPEEPKKEPKEEKKPEPRKLSETFETLKENKNVESLVSYVQTHIQDTVAYVLMILGIVWMFFQSFYGGILVGLVGCFYFSKEIHEFIKSFNELVEKEGLAKSIILGGAGLALFVSAPGIFIGAAIMLGLKIMLKAD
ncbi:MAG: hypothetical protein ACE5GN_07700 [Waddliaceae bacterium]